ncbi:putative HTH-type transcriptional activator CmpR [uncultured Desulfatiglans sp.]|nr:putative HTH-type transcriptional activator CmpR [uncultured Desulfatiglans sp.]
MRVNLNQLRAFFLATREKSITKAAESLYVTQPAVTMQIKALEEDLDLKLFTRYGKALELTETGRVLFGYAERIFEIVEEMEYVLKGRAELSQGSLVIGTTRSFARHLMPQILSRFQERYPDIKVYLKEASSTSIAEGIIAHEFNVGIIARIPFRSRLSVVPYSKEEFCLVVPTTHRFARMQTVHMSDLATEPIIIREEGSGSRYAILSFLDAYGIKPSVLLEAESLEFIKQYVIQGRGVTIMYKPDIRLETQLGLLKPINLAEGPIQVQTDMIFAKGIELNPATKAFLSLFEG